MELKISKNTFRKKLINHILKKGNKQVIEKTLTKVMKQTQKQQQKNITNIIQLSIINAAPVFKIINLTNKKRRKKSTKQIPVFLSHTKFRFSLSLKNISKTTTHSTKQKISYKNFINELLLSAKLENNVIKFKNDLQIQANKEKKYLRYYRW